MWEGESDRSDGAEHSFRSSPFRSDVAYVVCLLLALAIPLAIVLPATWTPTNDGPQHVLGAYARAHVDDAARGYGEFVEPNEPITGIGFSTIFDVAQALLPWRAAHQTSVGVVLLLYVASAAALCGALGRRWLGLLFVPLAFQWHFFLGLFAFLVGSSLALLLIAVVLRRAPQGPIGFALLACALYVVACAHFMAAILGGVVVLVLVLAATRRERRWRASIALLAAGIPAFLVALLTKLAGLGEATRTAWEDPGARAAALADRFVGGPAWLATGSLLLALVGAATAIRRERGPRRLLGAVALAFLVAPLLLPSTMFGWQLASARPLVVGGTIGIALLPIDAIASVRWRSLAIALLAVFGLGGLARAALLQRRCDDRFADAWSAFDALPRDRVGYRLPLLLEGQDAAPLDSVAGWSPLQNLGSLYATAHGGMSAYSFDGLVNNHFVLLRPEMKARLPRPPDRAYWLGSLDNASADERSAIVERMARWGRLFDGVVVYGRVGDLDRFVDRGYRVEHRQGGLLVASFVGCSTSLSIRADPSVPVVITSGWWPRDETSDVAFVDAPDEHETTVALPALGCGPAWLQVRPIMDVGLHCAEEDADGVVVVDTRRDHAVVCTLVAE